jgi:hypothetical protein
MEPSVEAVKTGCVNRTSFYGEFDTLYREIWHINKSGNFTFRDAPLGNK